MIIALCQADPNWIQYNSLKITFWRKNKNKKCTPLNFNTSHTLQKV